MACSSSSWWPACYLLVVVSLALAMAPCRSDDSPEDYLNPHNVARTDVGVAVATWDDTVAADAKNYTAQLKAECQLQASGNKEYGENMYLSSSVSSTAADAVASWVSEKQWYDHDSNSFSAPEGNSCGHYTQVVWHNSTHIGCDNDAGVIITCNYSPPGNDPAQSPY